MNSKSFGLAAIERLATGAAGDPFSWSGLEVSGHVSTETAFQTPR